MKTTMSLLLLSVGLAYAQRPDFSRSDYGGQSTYRNRIEGTYESDLLGGRIHRTLRIQSDGRVEIVTESGRNNRDWNDRNRNDRNRNDRDRDNRNWENEDGPGVQDRMYLGRYGRTAVEASRGRTVRHTGRWTQRNDQIILRMDELRLAGVSGDWNQGNGRGQANGRGQGNGRWRDDRSDLRLVRRGDGFVLSGDMDLYGRDPIVFRGDLNRGNDWPRGDDRLGVMRYDNERLSIDRMELSERTGDDRLTVTAGRRTFEFRGEARKENGTTVFRVRRDNRDSGTFYLTMRGDRVVGIRGSGEENGRRVSFENATDRRY